MDEENYCKLFKIMQITTNSEKQFSIPTTETISFRMQTECRNQNWATNVTILSTE